MRILIVSTLIVFLFALGLATAQDTPPSPQSVPPSDLTASFHVTDLEATTLVYQTFRLKPEEFAVKGRSIIETMQSDMVKARIGVAGGPIIIYTQSPRAGQAMDVQVGFPVPASTAPPVGYAVRQLQAGPSAVMLYMGSTNGLGDAIQGFYDRLREAGRTPGHELRIRSLFWQGEDSGNNVVMIDLPLPTAQ